ncbi:MAG: hypothetical protein HQ522_10220 [Bacteroidetes bacterium]|nr:hypothetical protein [Bacteroidota bacterium]
MIAKIFTPALGAILGFITSWESFKSILFSLLMAFLCGIAAAIGKILVNWINNKYIKPKKYTDEKTIG